MVTEILKYIAEDGTAFDSYEAATAYEMSVSKRQKILDHLYDETSLCYSECKETVKFLFDNYNITAKE